MHQHLDRVVVVGTSCSGKSSFALALAERLGLPRHELDEIFWLPGWRELPREDFRKHVGAVVQGERWVIDGNYSSVRDLVWPRATVLVWLDYGFPVVWHRAFTRTCRRVFTREEICAGNRETFRQSFLSRDSILLWVLKTYRLHRRNKSPLLARPEHAHLRVLRFRRPREATRFLESL